MATNYHRYYTEGIGNGSRAAIHCIILASGRQCSINQHLLSDHVRGTFSKSKDISSRAAQLSAQVRRITNGKRDVQRPLE